jgi:hypothetical protein
VPERINHAFATPVASIDENHWPGRGNQEGTADTHLIPPPGPLPTGQAARALGLTSRTQIDKLIGSGLIPVIETNSQRPAAP